MKSYLKFLTDISAGFLFGLGLIISGMSHPLKVQGFLDIAGDWDPSLMLVMGGAISVAIIPFYFINKQSKTWLSDHIRLPNKQLINRRLMIGNAIFGIGWGLAGICPGPAIVSLGSDVSQAALFIAAMLLGTKLVQLAEKNRLLFKKVLH